MSSSFTENLGYGRNSPGTTLFVVQLVFLLLAWIISLLRAHVKLRMIRKVTAEDYWMLAALVRKSPPLLTASPFLRFAKRYFTIMKHR